MPVLAGSLEDELNAAKAEYEQPAPGDEAARARYVLKLAHMMARQVDEYRRTGERGAEYEKLYPTISAELQKHPLPKNSDATKLSRLLVGKWESPRRVYVFRADGKSGNEDGEINSKWRIAGNQLIEDGSRGTIILLDADYFIYAEQGNVFFHSRVKD